MTGRVRPVVLAALVAAGSALATIAAPGAPADAVTPGAGGVLLLACGLLLLLATVPEQTTGSGVSVLVFAGLTVTGVAAAQEMLRPGLPLGHDLVHHVWGLWGVWRTVLDGGVLPRWIPHLGVGMPLLQFYGPLPFVAAWPLQAAGASPYVALKAVCVLGSVVTAWTTFASLRWLGASRPASAVGAAVLVLAPYRLLDVNERMAFAESCTFPLLVPLLAAVWRAGREDDRRAAAVVGVTSVLLLLTHPLSLLVTGVVSAPLLAWAWLGRGVAGAAAPRRLAVALLLAGGVSAAWWVPFAAEIDATAVAVSARDGERLVEMAMAPGDLAARRVHRPRRADADTAAPTQELETVYSFGATLGALLLAGLVAPGRQGVGDGDEPSPRPWSAIALALVLLAVRPSAAALPFLPVLGWVQFPWRLLAPASALTAVAGALTVDRWLAGARPRRAALAVATILAALAWDATPFLVSSRHMPAIDAGRPVRFGSYRPVGVELPRDRLVRVEEAVLPPADYAWDLGYVRRVFPEYSNRELAVGFAFSWLMTDAEPSRSLGVTYRFPAGAGPAVYLDPAPYALLVGRGGEGLEVLAASERAVRRPLPVARLEREPPPIRWWRSPTRIRLALPEGHPGGRLRVAEGSFEGWRVQLDGGSWRSVDPMGLLTAEIPAGVREVVFSYSMLHPPDRAVGLAVSLVSVLAIVVVASRRRFGRHR